MIAQKLIRILMERNYNLSDIILIIEGYFNCSYNKALIDEITLDDRECQNVLDLLDKDYPPAYIAGYIDTRKIKVFVNENALIPRTETIDFINGYIYKNYDFNGKKVLDLCTGSGIIALLLKKKFDKADILASDLSKEALKLASKSAEYNKLDIKFIRSDFLENIDDKFDYIISNPPYIEIDNKQTYAPYEPALALYSGVDGLDSYRDIFKKLDTHLNEKGVAFFEIETTNYDNVIQLVKTMLPRYDTTTYKDVEGKERYIVLKKK